MDMTLEKMIQELLARIDTLERENARLKEENEQLKKRLAKNSRIVSQKSFVREDCLHDHLATT